MAGVKWIGHLVWDMPRHKPANCTPACSVLLLLFHWLALIPYLPGLVHIAAVRVPPPKLRTN